MNAVDQRCAECGSELPRGTPLGFCAYCALEATAGSGLEGVQTEPAGPKNGVSTTFPRTFGDYELLELLGRGGMGVVYKAHQFSLNQDVALKMVLDSKQHSPQANRRFQLEAEAAARLRHPNIVRIYHIGEEDGEQFFTMELIEGKSLSRWMAKGEFRVPADASTKAAVHQMQARVARLIATVARAVAYAHEQGVLHRDIKPGNIVLDANGEPHLTDFGLAGLATNSATVVSDSAAVAGTPTYMAPEQARGERLSRAADIYSLGVVLYELLAGKPPFVAPTPLETLRLVTEQEPANPTTITRGVIDADLATIALKCLEKNPAARYGSAGDLADDLERWLGHKPIHARPVGPVLRMQRWGQRNPLGASFIAVLVLGVMTSSGLLLRIHHEKQKADEERKIAQRRADNIRNGIIASMQRLWNDSKRQFEFIDSEQLSAFLPTPKPDVDYYAPHIRLSVGVSVTEKSPIAQASRFARPLAQMEQRLSELLGKPIFVDLKLFKFKSAKVAEVISGDVDFASLGPFAYVAARKLQPGLMPVARDDSPKPGVFFARKGSGITNFIQFEGKRMAFGDPSSSISLWAKVYLARSNFFGANFADWNHFNTRPVFLEHLQKQGLRATMEEKSHSHAMAMEAVLTNKADIGVARRDYVQARTKNDFEIISGFESTPQLWVASTNVATNVFEAFRRAVLEAKNIDVMEGAERRSITHLVPVEDSFFDGLRQVITNELKRFEGDRPLQSKDGGAIGVGGEDE